jgi:hypothetical protein
MRRNDNTALILAILGTIFLVLLVVTTLNDKGADTEVAMLEGVPVVAQATDAQCDAMYHAIWKVKAEPSHSTLIEIAKGLDCPFTE